MAITKELLDANSSLASLSEEQKAAITTLSANDEETVIGTKIGELHGQYDADVLAVTGEKKLNGEKTYDFVKRVLASYKSKVEGSETELEKAKLEKQDLEKKIKDGATDAVIVKKLSDAEQTITQLKETITLEQKKVTDAETTLDKTTKAIKAEFALESAVSSLTFKTGLPEAVTKTLVDVAKKDILANATPDFIEKADGTTQLVFRDASGEIIKNKAKLSEPMTAGDFISSHASLKDIIENGEGNKGGGTGPAPKNQYSGQLDLSSAKTQVEADEFITDHLLKTGVVKGTTAFKDAQVKLRTENNVGELPMR